VSFVIPAAGTSAHQPASMSKGDDWVGKVVGSVMSGPDWGSTAIFISFDDCGCLYDDVNPLQYSQNWGPRLPMLIVSPYARPGYTDSTPATPISVLTFIEKTFGLQPLNPCAGEDSWDQDCTDDVKDWDGGPTYDFSNSFDFSAPQAGRAPMVHVGVPPAERAWLAAHPNAGNQAT
jgi:phospholipase C